MSLLLQFLLYLRKINGIRQKKYRVSDYYYSFEQNNFYGNVCKMFSFFFYLQSTQPKTLIDSLDWRKQMRIGYQSATPNKTKKNQFMEMGENFIKNRLAWLWFEINMKKSKVGNCVFFICIYTHNRFGSCATDISRVGCRLKQIKSWTLWWSKSRVRATKHEMLQFINDMVGKFKEIAHIMKPINEWKYIIIKRDGVTFSSVNGLVQPLRCLHLIFSIRVDFNICIYCISHKEPCSMV